MRRARGKGSRTQFAAVGAIVAVGAACSAKSSSAVAASPDPDAGADAAAILRCASSDAQTVSLVAAADAAPPWVEASITLSLDTSALGAPDLTTADGRARWAAAFAPLQDDVERELVLLGARAIVRRTISADVLATVRSSVIPHLPCLPHVKTLSGEGFGCGGGPVCTLACSQGGTPSNGQCATGCHAVSGLAIDLARSCVTDATLACAAEPLSTTTDAGFSCRLGARDRSSAA